MALRSLNLPGFGTKYEFDTDKGDTVAIFFTKTGTIQMYTLQNGCKTPSAAETTPVETRRLENILTGQSSKRTWKVSRSPSRLLRT